MADGYSKPGRRRFKGVKIERPSGVVTWVRFPVVHERSHSVLGIRCWWMPGGWLDLKPWKPR